MKPDLHPFTGHCWLPPTRHPMLNGDLQLFRRQWRTGFPMDYDDPQWYNLWIMLVHKL